MSSLAFVETAGKCPDCGKDRFKSEKGAKRASRRIHPTDRLNAYRCGAYWHYGHVETGPKRPKHAPLKPKRKRSRKW